MAHETQFGFREGRGTTTAVSLAHDMVKCMNNCKTPVYICSLDAQKCFDSIWHDGLFHKLDEHMSDLHWIFLYKWYKSSKAQVRWANELSNQFGISKGIRQGSILSPRLFSIFINDLLAMAPEKCILGILTACNFLHLICNLYLIKCLRTF